MRQKTLIKIVVGLAAAALFGVLFIRSVRNVGAEPYTMGRAELAGWTVGLDPSPEVSGVLLALWPPSTLAPPLFAQLFRRSGLSLSGPNPVAMPLVLKREFDQALTGALTPGALVQLARDGGLESVQPKPACMANRRISQPGLTRDLFFIRFDFPAFTELRRQLAARVGPAGAGAAGFDPGGLSPVVIVAASDGNFASWLPTQGDAGQDCLAPIELQ